MKQAIQAILTTHGYTHIGNGTGFGMFDKKPSQLWQNRTSTIQLVDNGDTSITPVFSKNTSRSLRNEVYKSMEESVKNQTPTIYA
jgi:hypothetical protein